MLKGDREAFGFHGLRVVLLAGTLSACAAQRPVLYPNEQLHRVGSEVAEHDISDCMQRASQYVSSGGHGGEVARSAAESAGTGAAVGAAGGAAGGAVLGNAGAGAAAGAAGGGAAGLMHSLLGGMFRSSGPSPAYKSFVEQCLRERGYQPIGWQ